MTFPKLFAWGGQAAMLGARRKLNTYPSISISGIVAHGEELFANGARYDTLQWYADGVAISGQSGSMYTVDRADGVIGPEITCVATSEYGSVTSNALAYYPSQLSGIRAVYDFGRGVTLSGSYVTALADQSAAGNNLTAPTLANAPLLNLADKEFGGQGSATFDGVDDYLYNAALDMSGTVAAITMIMPLRLITNVNGAVLTSYNNAGVRFYQSTVGRVAALGAGTSVTPSKDARVEPYIMELSWNGTELSAYNDGVFVASASGTTTAPANSTFAIGGGSWGTNFSNFKTPMLCMLNRALTADERADFQSYFDWRFPQQAVDLLTAGTFTRASEASYLTAAPTDGTTPFMAWAASNERRIESGKLLIEGARTNLVGHNYNLDGFGWGLVNSTWTGSLDPVGTNEAMRIECTSSTGYIFRSVSTTSGSIYTTTQWVKPHDAGDSWSMRTSNPNVMTGSDSDADTTWRRVELPAAVVSATSFNFGPADGRVLAPISAGARDQDVYLPQVELGTFPTSPIRTVGSVTRAADVLTYASGTYPASFCTEGFRFTFTPIHSSDELIAGGNLSHVLAGFTTSTFNRVEFRVSGGNILVRVYDGTMVQIVTATPLTFSRGQELTFEIRPTAGSVTLSGFTTGNETTVGTSMSFANDVLRVGAAGNGTLPVFGHFSDFEAL